MRRPTVARAQVLTERRARLTAAWLRVAPPVLGLCLGACSKTPNREVEGLAAREAAAAPAPTTRAPPPDAAARIITPTLTPLELPSSAAALGPRFATGAGAPTLTWLEESAADASVTVMLSQHSERGWSSPRPMVTDPRILTNWADVPAAHRLPSGQWVLAYPQHRREGGRDYGLVVARFDRDLRPIGEWIPDDVAQGPETGFVDIVGDAQGATLLWLDGRQMPPRDADSRPPADERSGPSKAAAHGAHGDGDMTLRALRIDEQGRPRGTSTVVDHRTCECCKLDGAMGSKGPWVVYRDRDTDERRDIRAVSMRAALGPAGSESSPLAITASLDVHRDGWVMPGCPVNGPALTRSRDHLFVAWFSAANGEPRVSIARSDAGAPAFEQARRVDLNDPVGRVDLIALEGGDLVVTWIERDADRPGRGRLLSRLVSPTGEMGPPIHVHEIGIGRDWGFPRAHEHAGQVRWIWTNADSPHTSLEGVRIETRALRAASRAGGLSPQSDSVG